MWRKASSAPGIDLAGLHMHLGSPILKTEPYRQGCEKAVTLIEAFRRRGTTSAT
jgi:diaminopimelate decarboxylase